MSEYKFLKPSKHIDSCDERIIRKAKELAGHQKSKHLIVESFFVYIQDHIDYYNSPGSIATASEVLVTGAGDSIGKACLLAALCRVMEIPAGVSFQLIKDMKMANTDEGENMSLRWHTVTNVNLDGTWLKLDPTYDWWLAHGRHSSLPGFVKNEGIVIPTKDSEGKGNFTIIRESPMFEDIPEEWVLELANHKNELL